MITDWLSFSETTILNYPSSNQYSISILFLGGCRTGTFAWNGLVILLWLNLILFISSDFSKKFTCKVFQTLRPLVKFLLTEKMNPIFFQTTLTCLRKFYEDVFVTKKHWDLISFIQTVDSVSNKNIAKKKEKEKTSNQLKH